MRKLYLQILKLSLFIVVQLVAYGNLSAQDWQWLNGTLGSGNQFSRGITLDHDGNIVYCGSMNGTPVTVFDTSLGNTAGADIYLTKITPSGSLLWVVKIASTGQDFPTGVAVDEDNNIYLTGSFRAEITFNSWDAASADPPTGEPRVVVGILNVKSDAFLAKYNANGQAQWAKRVASSSGTALTVGEDVVVDGNGKVWMAGSFQNNITFTEGVTHTTGTNYGHQFIARFASDGTYEWSNYFQTTTDKDNNKIQNIDLAPNGGIYIGGYFNGTLTYNSSSILSSSGQDIFAIQLKSDGTYSWGRKAGGSGQDRGNSMISDENGNVYLAGYVSGTNVKFDSTFVSGSVVQTTRSFASKGGSDMFIAKYNSEGRFLWASLNGNTADDIAYGISTSENLVFLSGNFTNQLTFNGTTITSSPLNISDTGFFVYDTDGNPVTAEQLLGIDDDRGNAILYDSEGHSYVAGEFKSTSLSAGLFSLGNLGDAGKYNSFLAKYENPFSSTFTTKTNITCNGGSNGELSVTTFFGTEPYTYAWLKDGLSFGSDTPTLSDLSAGTYKVTVTDSNLKTTESTTTITQPTAITAGIPVTTNATCPGGSDGAITLDPSGGTGLLTFFWTTQNGNGLVTDDEDQTDLSAGSYCLTITDENGCEFADTYEVTAPATIEISGTVTNITNPGDNGAVAITGVIGGTGTYPDDFTFNWVGAEVIVPSNIKDISGLSTGGDYTVTVTDSKGCQQDQAFNVVDEQIFSIWISSITNVKCHGGSTGSATVSYFRPAALPDNPISYSWTLSAGGSELATSAAATGLAAGTYKVVVTYDDGDGNPLNNEYTIDNIVITEPSAITGSITPTPTNCFGGSKGKALLTVSGGTLPYTYLWNTGAVSKDLTAKPAGDYSVTVTDKNGCEKLFETTITQPDDIVISITETPVTCYGGKNGELSITDITGGNGGFSQIWSNSLTAATISNLKAKSYSVTVTDSKGCQKFKSATVSQPAQITATFDIAEPLCYGGSNGVIAVNAAGGTSSYEYSKNGGLYQVNNTFIGLIANTYSISVKDDAGCTRSFNVVVDEPSELLVSHIENKPTCLESTNGSIGLTVTGGTGVKTYFWTGSGISLTTDKNQSGLGVGNYSVRVTDANDCYVDYPVELVAANSSPTAYEVTGGGEYCAEGSGVLIGLEGSQLGVDYQLKLNGDINGSPVSGNDSPISFGNKTLAGTYTAVGTSAAGCVMNMTGNAVVSIEPTPIAGSLERSPVGGTICEGMPVSATLTAGTGGNGIDEIEYRTTSNGTDWTSWLDYNSGDNISSDGLANVQIRTRRMASYCSSSSYVTEGWTVEETPVSGTLTKSPNVASVCGSELVSATLTEGSGGNGVDELESRAHNGTTWSSWSAYTSGNTLNALGKTQIEIRTRRTASTCGAADYTSVSWTVEETPVSGLLSKSPNVASVCGSELVSATLAEGSGGNGVDELESRAHNGTTWSSWSAYTSGNTLNALGKTQIEIRTRRTASTCGAADYTSVLWTVEETPVSGTLTKSPNVESVCDGTLVLATLTAGSGGNGVDELEYSTNGTDWMPYTSGNDIPSVGLASVQIRTRRTASTCSAAEYISISWTVEETPVSGTLTKSPNVASVCGSELVSATLTAGSGGNGVDELEYSTNGTDWMPYTSGNDIPSVGLVSVQIRTRRMASTCGAADYTSVSWTVEETPVSGTLTKSPNVASVCGGELVSATLTAGSGGNGVDELEYSTNGIDWMPYTSGDELVTEGVLLQIRTKLNATYCSDSEYNVVGWTINPITAPGVVTGGSVICSGSTSGTLLLEGNVGAIIRWEKSVSPFDSWTAISNTSTSYTSSVLDETTRFRAIVKSGACDEMPSGFAEVEVIQTMGGEILGVSLVCSGTTSGIMTLQDYEGSILSWQYSVTGTLLWNTIPGTADLTTYESSILTKSTSFRVRVKNGSCQTVLSQVKQVEIESNSVGGTVTGGTDICIGQTSDILTLQGNIGDVVKWQYSENGGTTWLDISNIESTYTSGELTQTTQFRAVVKNGICDESVSEPTTVSVNQFPEPIISNTSRLAVCANDPVSVGFTVNLVNANSYQWMLNDLPISGAVESIYTATETGKYTVEVNVKGCLGTSNPLVVSIVDNPVPTISTEDLLFYCEGEDINVELTSSITNAEAYQWRLNGEPISNAYSSTYGANQAGGYSLGVVVDGCSGLSDEVLVVVNPLPEVNAPDNIAVCKGEAVTLSASGNATEYLWDNDVVDGEPFVPTQTQTYNVVGSIFETGCSATDNVTVTVKPLPQPIVTADGNLDICEGDDIAVQFTVDIDYADAYQWLLNGQPIEGGTLQSLLAIEVGDYSVQVIVDGCTGFSDASTISVISRPEPVISSLASLNVCEGEEVSVAFSVDIDNADLYQWMLGGQPIIGAETKDYIATAAGTYSVEVMVNGCTGLSNEQTVVIIANPIPTISTTDILTYYTGEVIDVNFTTDIQDANLYQWMLNGDDIEDATQATYNATSPGVYSLMVTVNGCSGVSNSIEILQLDLLLPIISTIDPLSWCDGLDISVTFTVSEENADSYLWYIDGVSIEDATSDTYIANAPGKYTVEVTKGEQIAFSNELEVVVITNPIPIISTTDPVSWCTGTSISVLMEVDIVDADSYQWLLEENEIDDATLATFTADAPGKYSVKVVVNGCEGVSNSIQVVEEDELHPVISTTDQTQLCEGDEISITLTVDITTADSYQWQLDGVDIEDANQSVLVATQPGSYTVSLVAGACSGSSNAITVIVNPVPEPTISTVDNLIWGEDVEISVTFTVDISDADTYQWLLNGEPIADATANTYVASAVGEYSVLVTSSTCVGESNKLTVSVSSVPVYVVTFTVKNSVGDPIIGAEVKIEELEPIFTNASGLATLQLADGTYAFVVKASDYSDYSNEFTINGDGLPIDVTLVSVGVPFDELSQINLFPNPFSNVIKISNAEIVDRVIITNIAGQKVFEIRLDGADRINTQVLPTGVYLLRLTLKDGRSAIFRMVKEN